MMTYSSTNVESGCNDCLCTMAETSSKWGILNGITILQAYPLNPICTCVLCINAIYVGCGSIDPIKESADNAKIVANHATVTLHHSDWEIPMGFLPSSSELSINESVSHGISSKIIFALLDLLTYLWHVANVCYNDWSWHRSSHRS